MPELIITVGLPASGKTTWAKDYQETKQGSVRVNNEDIVKNFLLSKSPDTRLIWMIRKSIVFAGIEAQKDIIIDNCNLPINLQEGAKKLADEHNYSFHIMDFTEVPLEECIERDYNRLNRIGEKKIREMFNVYLYPSWVCRRCGIKASYGKDYTDIAPIRQGVCGVCKEHTDVFHPQYFGNPKF